MKYGSPQAKPELHTSHSQNSNQQHTQVSLTLYCITIRVGIAQEAFTCCHSSQPVEVVLISIDSVAFLRRALVSVDVVSLLVVSTPTIAGYAKAMEKLP